MRRASLSAFFLVTCLCIAASAQQVRTIFLVRHAEKVSNAADALLSDVGKKRAECLANTLADAQIHAIYTTEVKRTQQTAEPTAQHAGVTVTVVPGKDIAGLVTKLQSGDSPALVVGHSNTLPAIIEALGAGKIKALGDNEYDGLYIVTLDPKAGASLVKLHYCDCGKPRANDPAQGMNPKM